METGFRSTLTTHTGNGRLSISMTGIFRKRRSPVPESEQIDD